MNRTLQHIQYLLSQHDCVIIPGFGALLAHGVAAYRDDAGRMLPPRRAYSFNQLLKDDDGMLAHSIARQAGVDYVQARAEVERDVAAMRRDLSEQGQLSLGRAGILTCNEGNIEFFPPATDSVTPMASWRPAIQPVVLVDRARALRQQMEQGIARQTWRHRAGSAFRAAASILILLAISIAVSTPVEVDNVDYASLYPEIKTAVPSTSALKKDKAHKTAKYPASMAVSKPVTAGNGNIEVATVTPSCAANPKAKAEDKTVSGGNGKAVAESKPYATATSASKAAEIRFRDNDPYCVIVASLSSAEDAAKFIDEQYRSNPGMALDVLEKDGRYRVYAATGASKAAAQSMASDSRIARRFKGAWVCAR